MLHWEFVLVGRGVVGTAVAFATLTHFWHTVPIAFLAQQAQKRHVWMKMGACAKRPLA